MINVESVVNANANKINFIVVVYFFLVVRTVVVVVCSTCTHALLIL